MRNKELAKDRFDYVILLFQRGVKKKSKPRMYV